MAEVNDGGPAFPAPSVYGDENHGHTMLERGEYGMSLRDYFAGQALAGYLAMFSGPESSLPSADVCAEMMYRLADAMVAARNKCPK